MATAPDRRYDRGKLGGDLWEGSRMRYAPPIATLAFMLGLLLSLAQQVVGF
jgi:hypothetical protein